MQDKEPKKIRSGMHIKHDIVKKDMEFILCLISIFCE